MRTSVRRTMVVAAIVALTATGGVATASADVPDGDDPIGEIADQLPGADSVSDALDGGSNDDGGSDDDGQDRGADDGSGGSDDRGILLPGQQGREILPDEVIELSEDGIDQLRGITDNLTDPVNELVCELTDEQLELLDLTRTDVQLLGDCVAEPVNDVDEDKDEDEKGREDKPAGQDTDEDEGDDDAEPQDVGDDDSHTVPTGGIETGGGGTAGGPAAPSAPGSLPLAAAAAVLTWRTRAGSSV